MNKEKLNLYNGNDKQYTIGLPKITILTNSFNLIALNHIEKNTGLKFVKDSWNNYSAQPIESNQIVRLFLTYNFKTEYNDNVMLRNTILLKFDHNIGFKINSICKECVKYNNISINDIESINRLAC